MRTLIVAASLIALAAPGVALAGQDAAPPAPDRVLTRADALAAADRRFDAIDTDHDGKISAAERAAMPQRGPGRMGGMPRGPNGETPSMRGPGGEGGAPRGPGGGARMLDQADADKDGVITRDEFRATAAANFDRQDANKDGKVDATERRQWRDRRMSQAKPHGGTITRAAFQARALARFDRMDLNKDGQLDPAERQKLHGQRMERRGPRAAG